MTTVEQNSTIHYSSYPAWRSLWGPILVGIVGLAFYGAGLLAIPIILYARYRDYYVIRADEGQVEIEARRGIIARHTASIRARDLRNINVHQSVMQRLLGIGTVEFSSAGGTGIEVSFEGICQPQQIKTLVQTLQRTK